MSPLRLCSVLVAAMVGASLLAVTSGCGGGGSTPTAPGDVPLTMSVVADTPGSISSVTLATGRADTLDITGASAYIDRADGTSAPVAIDINAAANVVTLGQATVTLSGADGAASATASNGPAQADVPFLAEIAADAPGEITSVTVTAIEPGDTFDIAGATARLEHSDGTVEPVDLSINTEGTVVTTGRALVGGRYMYDRLVIDGPIRVHDGPTATATEIGGLAFSFHVLYGGVVVVPTTIRASIPTIGSAKDGRVVVDGLPPHEASVRTIITDRDGGRIYSRVYVADASGQAVIPDSKSQITAELLSGPNSRIEMWFFNWYGIPLPPPAPPGPVDPMPGRQGRLNMLAVDGPIRIRSGNTGRITEIGRLRLGFEVLGDGTVIAPRQVKICIPTNGAAGDPGVVVSGLNDGDFLRTVIVDASGRRTNSRIYLAGTSGDAAIPRALTNITASRLSGPDSQIALLFARTDADRDGYPDMF